MKLGSGNCNKVFFLVFSFRLNAMISTCLANSLSSSIRFPFYDRYPFRIEKGDVIIMRVHFANPDYELLDYQKIWPFSSWIEDYSLRWF